MNGDESQPVPETAPDSDHRIALLRSARKPQLYVISGPSGVGKDTVVKELRERFPEIQVAVTATTRDRRPGEINGVDYFFYDRDHFENQLALGEFLESAEVYGRWYGVPKHSVRHALERGQDVIVKVDVQGAATIRQIVPDAIMIFIAPGSRAELLQRLRNRKTEDTDDLLKRFETAEEELQQVDAFDYVVFNDHRENGLPDSAIDGIAAIITAERHRVRQKHLSV